LKRSVILLFLFFINTASYPERYEKYNSFIRYLNPVEIENQFSNLDEIKEMIKSKNTDSLTLYKAGIFCMYNIYKVINKIKYYNDRDEEEIAVTAKKCFEEAYKKEKNNPFITGYRGVCYLYLCKWGAYNEKIQNGQKGTYYLNKAVDMYPESIEIRRIRINSFIYLPFQYYPDVPGMIENDADFIINKVLDNKKNLLGYYTDDIINSFLHEAYYMKGVLFIKTNRKQEALKYLDNIDKSSFYYQKLLDYMNK